MMFYFRCFGLLVEEKCQILVLLVNWLIDFNIIS